MKNYFYFAFFFLVVFSAGCTTTGTTDLYVCMGRPLKRGGCSGKGLCKVQSDVASDVFKATFTVDETKSHIIISFKETDLNAVQGNYLTQVGLAGNGGQFFFADDFDFSGDIFQNLDISQYYVPAQSQGPYIVGDDGRDSVIMPIQKHEAVPLPNNAQG